MKLVSGEHESLSMVSHEVVKGDDLAETIDGMLQLMSKSRGIGLAANQIGLLKRVIVVSVSGKDGYFGEIINPVITRKTDTIKMSQEGCLSFPHRQSRMKRNFKVTVNGFDRHWNPISINAKGLLSFCLQHEIDHLNGITI